MDSQPQVPDTDTENSGSPSPAPVSSSGTTDHKKGPYRFHAPQAAITNGPQLPPHMVNRQQQPNMYPAGNEVQWQYQQPYQNQQNVYYGNDGNYAPQPMFTQPNYQLQNGFQFQNHQTQQSQHMPNGDQRLNWHPTGQEMQYQVVQQVPNYQMNVPVHNQCQPMDGNYQWSNGVQYQNQNTWNAPQFPQSYNQGYQSKQRTQNQVVQPYWNQQMGNFSQQDHPVMTHNAPQKIMIESNQEVVPVVQLNDQEVQCNMTEDNSHEDKIGEKLDSIQILLGELVDSNGRLEKKVENIENRMDTLQNQLVHECEVKNVVGLETGTGGSDVTKTVVTSPEIEQHSDAHQENIQTDVPVEPSSQPENVVVLEIRTLRSDVTKIVSPSPGTGQHSDAHQKKIQTDIPVKSNSQSKHVVGLGTGIARSGVIETLVMAPGSEQQPEAHLENIQTDVPAETSSANAPVSVTSMTNAPNPETVTVIIPKTSNTPSKCVQQPIAQIPAVQNNTNILSSTKIVVDVNARKPELTVLSPNSMFSEEDFPTLSKSFTVPEHRSCDKRHGLISPTSSSGFNPITLTNTLPISPANKSTAPRFGNQNMNSALRSVQTPKNIKPKNIHSIQTKAITASKPHNLLFSLLNFLIFFAPGSSGTPKCSNVVTSVVPVASTNQKLSNTKGRQGQISGPIKSVTDVTTHSGASATLKSVAMVGTAESGLVASTSKEEPKTEFVQVVSKKNNKRNKKKRSSQNKAVQKTSVNLDPAVGVSTPDSVKNDAEKAEKVDVSIADDVPVVEAEKKPMVEVPRVSDVVIRKETGSRTKDTVETRTSHTFETVTPDHGNEKTSKTEKSSPTGPAVEEVTANGKKIELSLEVTVEDVDGVELVNVGPVQESEISNSVSSDVLQNFPASSHVPELAETPDQEEEEPVRLSRKQRQKVERELRKEQKARDRVRKEAEKLLARQQKKAAEEEAKKKREEEELLEKEKETSAGPSTEVARPTTLPTSNMDTTSVKFGYFHLNSWIKKERLFRATAEFRTVSPDMSHLRSILLYTDEKQDRFRKCPNPMAYFEKRVNFWGSREGANFQMVATIFATVANCKDSIVRWDGFCLLEASVGVGFEERRRNDIDYVTAVVDSI